MSIENNNLPPGTPPPGQPGGQGGPGQPNKEGTFSQEFRHSPVSARVPERLTRGILSTGVLVLDGPNEFVLDFMQALTRPFQVAARVVLTPAVMEQFVVAVKDNIARYEQRFGGIPPLPKPPTDRRPTLQEIYDEFKLPEEQMSGNYANAVMVGHSASEFFFDFITNFYPTSAVSSRVFLSAPQMPRLLDAVTVAFGRFQQRLHQARQQGQNPPPQHPPTSPPQGPGPQS
ncbi:MAG TPA: DUF3467 domain-containing protein [Tepidisphaeraceae bacterium]|jgi:hypothetical protein|nr:DUF3467 domain-containing protein [Tepidisphaeraceae bacterium]